MLIHALVSVINN